MLPFQTDIPTLGNTASFYDWFNQYNDEVLGKLNNADISRPLAGDGITFASSNNGGYTFELSGTVAKQMTFQNSVVFSGNVSLGNVEVSGLIYGVSGNYLGIGVTTGKVVRLTNTGGLTLAKADAPENAEVMGIAISADTTRTLVAVAGKISGSTLANNLISGGFTSSCVFFLDPVVAGGITRTEPTTLGHVSKPVILGVNSSEGLILPYRGQHINGICGGSGDNIFNSAVLISVKSIGESAGDFQLRPGKLVAIATSRRSDSTSYQSSVDDTAYEMAKSTTPFEKIVGIATEYVGSYSETLNAPVGIKVNTIGSVIPATTIDTYSHWNVTVGTVVYLDADGNATSQSSEGLIPIGVLADGNFVFNPTNASQLTTTLIGPGAGSNSSSRNMLINGSLSLWQRGRGVTTGYGITAGVSGNKQYLADKFVMWATNGENGFTGSRQNFSLTQTEVPGYPDHYVQLRKNNTSPTGPAYFYNLLDDVRTIANKQVVFSFYARTSTGTTGTFAIHTIQNISVGSGNTYVNGVTHSVITAGSSWQRYSAAFVGPSANSGITNSYSLLGVRLDDNGKTYEFAQFMLEEGTAASLPMKVDIDEEYLKMKPYYQRSYAPREITGQSTLNVNNGVMYNLLYPARRVIYSFPERLKKAPNITIYSIDGKKDLVSIFSAGGYYDANGVLSPGYNNCSRVPIPSQIPSLIINSGSSSNEGFFSFSWTQLFCNFDDIAFHYTADADTTVN